MRGAEIRAPPDHPASTTFEAAAPGLTGARAPRLIARLGRVARLESIRRPAAGCRGGDRRHPLYVQRTLSREGVAPPSGAGVLDAVAVLGARMHFARPLARGARRPEAIPPARDVRARL